MAPISRNFNQSQLEIPLLINKWRQFQEILIRNPCQILIQMKNCVCFKTFFWEKSSIFWRKNRRLVNFGRKFRGFGLKYWPQISEVRRLWVRRLRGFSVLLKPHMVLQIWGQCYSFLLLNTLYCANFYPWCKKRVWIAVNSKLPKENIFLLCKTEKRKISSLLQLWKKRKQE